MSAPSAEKNRRPRPGDAVLVALAVVAALAGAIWLSAQGTGTGAQDGLVVVCQSKDGFYRVDPLDEDVTYTVSTPNGYNNVTIADGTVDVTSADCSNQVCVNTEPASQPGEQIVCLPHEVVIEVANDPDGVAPLA